ncbi:MAG: transglutaminase-like cysteine peptidase [Moraxellaceae bacterium]|nr:transglutaminase-like cysteine peptidase [Moraxellaceae bacterium]
MPACLRTAGHGHRPIFSFFRSFVVIFCVGSLLSACTAIPENLWAINRTISDRFVYVSDLDKWCVSNYVELDVTGDYPFSGDCEEYAIAVKHHLDHMGIAASVWRVEGNGVPHAVTCTEDGWCLDYNVIPTQMDKTPYWFIERMTILTPVVKDTGADAPEKTP